MIEPSSYSLAILGALQRKPEGAVYAGTARSRPARRRVADAARRRAARRAAVAARSTTARRAA